jgi:tetratricopeptide (TPR) repeat protein
VNQLGSALAGRYTIERELGRGGMATVYLAQDLRHHRQVALKVLQPDLASSLGPERFLREIEIAASLSHPHILPLLDSGALASADDLQNGTPYYVMPYVEGESLRDRLNREKQLTLEDTLLITRQVAEALSYAHSRGIIHRDPNPENILLQDGHAVVADFGIARAIDAAGGTRLTETGLAIGTPAYMSPEQATGDRVDARSDVYSLGCVVYEMLLGEPPYTGPSAAAIIARRLSEPLPSLRVVRDGVPSAVEQAVHKALARSAADRFRTAGQFARALTAPAAPVRARRAISSRTLLTAGATGLVLTGALVLPGALRRFRATVDPAANVIAVLPPIPTSPDTALGRLGQDLVVTLSSNFEGIEGMRVVDPLTVLAQAKGGRTDFSTLNGAVDFGRRFGASGVIRGALTRDGTRVRLYLALHDTKDSTIVAQTSVLGSPDSLIAVTDSATWSLLHQIWRVRDPPTPSLAAVTTRSVPALRAFLAGEQAVARGRWDDAEEAYATAIKEDSTFWLAYWRHSYSKAWKEESLDSVTLSVALAHLAELPEKERLLAEVGADRLDGQTIEILSRSRALTARFPNYWPAWFEYADQLFHSGPALGEDLRKATQAFQRTLELNPRLLPAWNHLFDAAIVLQDTAIVALSLRQLDSLDPLEPGAPPRDHRRLMSWQLPLLRGRPFEGAAADSLVVDIASVQSVEEQRWLALQFSAVGGPGAQIELSRRIIARTPWRTTAAIHRKGIAVSWAARGAWDSALAAIDEYASRASDLAGLTPEQISATGAGPDLAKLDPYRFAVVGSWLGALAPPLALARRKIAAEAVARIGSPWRQVELFWLDGILAVSQRDLAGLRQARRRLLESDTASARLPLQSLAAFELELLGHRPEAADSLSAASAWEERWIGPYWGINRLAAARWLAAEGDLDRAARLLPWGQSMIGDVGFVHGAMVLDGPSCLEMARVEAARGNQELAREYYQAFLRLYDQPLGRMQHLVVEARAELRRLE